VAYHSSLLLTFWTLLAFVPDHTGLECFKGHQNTKTPTVLSQAAKYWGGGPKGQSKNSLDNLGPAIYHHLSHKSWHIESEAFRVVKHHKQAIQDACNRPPAWDYWSAKYVTQQVQVVALDTAVMEKVCAMQHQPSSHESPNRWMITVPMQRTWIANANGPQPNA